MSIVKPPETGAFFKPPRQFPKRSPGGFPIGLRTERRARENRTLAKQKITRCEIRIEGVCVDRIMLTWAHSKLSRFIVTSKDWQEAARSCLPCHNYLHNKCSHHKMRAIILAAIHRRRPYPYP